MTLYLFNPEHDIALASGLSCFTPPRAGRLIRHDLGFLPALKAGKGDLVLVDDVDDAKASLKAFNDEVVRFGGNGFTCEATFIDDKGLVRLCRSTDARIDVKPWGWDNAVKRRLLRDGVDESSLPSDETLDVIRHMSHRQWAAENVLKPLRSVDCTVGEALFCLDSEAVAAHKRGCCGVMKAPWSSSGRGVRIMKDGSNLDGWAKGVIAKQGGIMIEPLYNKVCDLGAEFIAQADGRVRYRGLSVFSTSGTAYTGNIIDTEEHKRSLILKYISPQLLDAVTGQAEAILTEAFRGQYQGPLGIDMMVVDDNGTIRLHPCVEMNLRMTMGHVAIDLASCEALRGKAMNINYDGHYHLSLLNKG